MAQEVFNSTDNINIPHALSVWFQLDYTGNWIELGDCLVNEVNIAPEFQDFRSYRNGVNAVRKRLLSARNASATVTLNEPNIVNLQRVLCGGTIGSGQTLTVYDGRHLEADSDGVGTFFDLTDAGETDFGNIAVTGIYAQTDVTEATNLISANITPDTDGKCYFDATDTGISDGEEAYVKYTISVSSLYRSEIYGADDATIEGACKIQARNTSGGVVQVWDLASVHLAANGAMGYALDAIQTIPLLMTLQERGGTFGYIYAK
jgi:hypothetical protein